MPFIRTEKFDLDWVNLWNTTFKGKIEVWLYYSALDDNFYFKDEDLKKYFHSWKQIFSSSFSRCRTKWQAIMLFKDFIGEKFEERKVYLIQVYMDYPTYTSIPYQWIKDSWLIDSRSFDKEDNILTFKMKKLKEYTDSNNNKVYAECKENWDRAWYSPYPISSYGWWMVVPYTLETETFLNSFIENIANLNKNIAKFFSNINSEDDFLELVNKNTLLLSVWNTKLK